MSDRAVVLLSGGLDSAVVLAYALEERLDVTALSFDYGQRHHAELVCAQDQAADLTHVTVQLDGLSGGALMGDGDVPMHDSADELVSGEIASTYVPARNTVFLAHALALSEQLDAPQIFIGVNAVDYSGYPDCRPQYVDAFEAMARLATKRSVNGGDLRIRTPLIRLSKVDIVRKGVELGVDFSRTHSCYAPVMPTLKPSTVGLPMRMLACGHCDSCLLRLRAFEEAGLSDPVPYSERVRWSIDVHDA